MLPVLASLPPRKIETGMGRICLIVTELAAFFIQKPGEVVGFPCKTDSIRKKDRREAALNRRAISGID